MSEAPLAGAAWLSAPASATIFRALAGDGAETRFVGGVVRDGLLGRPVADVDFATTLTPDQTSRRLAAAGLRAAPTGLAHGTVTAIVDGRGFEVTTLRRDVATDGRHATVAFTDDWREDAARRDFTINAMSADATGRVFDYFGGREDLSEGRVRFVGEPAERVAEDYLRILRFFRFYAWYGAGASDSAALQACRAGVGGLGQVSAERSRVEILRLLSASHPEASAAAMAEAGVARALFGVDEVSDLAEIVAIEARAGLSPDPILRLAAFIGGRASDVARKLRLSNAEARALTAIAGDVAPLGDAPAAWRRQLHRCGVETFRRLALLAAARGEASLLDARLNEAAAWEPRRLPVGGRDLIQAGLTRGPALGAMLTKLEAYWSERDFSPDRRELLDLARRMAADGRDTG